MEYDNLLNEISVFISKTVTFYVASNIKLILWGSGTQIIVYIELQINENSVY